MALSKPSIAGQISGVLGGAEFASFKGRQILRNAKRKRPRPSPNRITAQAQHRAALQYWHSLSAANKRAWENAAAQRPRPDRFGIQRNLSGMQLFLTIPHDFRFGVEEHWEDTPPLLNNAFENPVTATWQAPYNCQVQAVYAIEPGWTFVHTLFASRFQNAGARSSRNWRKVGLVFDEAGVYPDFDTSLEALNIAAIAGEVIRLRYQLYQWGTWPIWYDIGQITVTA